MSTAAAQVPPPTALLPRQARRLRLGNLVVGLVHLAQVVVLLVLSEPFDIPIVEIFPQGPPGTAPPAPDLLADLPLGPTVAAFLALAAIDHLLVAAPGVHRWYERQMSLRIGTPRWIEYSVSATLMVLLIAVLAGVLDAVALVGIAGANVAMILFGHRMERVNGPEIPMGDPRVDFQPWWFGVVAGAFPWIAIGLSLFGAQAESGQVPGFVFGIFGSLLVLFSSFGINQYLQYKGVGRWREYLFGEWAYIVLSLVAKSALAWQVFANVLIDPAAG